MPSVYGVSGIIYFFFLLYLRITHHRLFSTTPSCYQIKTIHHHFFFIFFTFHFTNASFLQLQSALHCHLDSIAGRHKHMHDHFRVWKIKEQFKVGMHGCQGTVSHCVHPAVRGTCSGTTNSQSLIFFF